MKYVITYGKPGPGGAPRRLPDGVSIDTISGSCRAAGVEFLEGVSRGWSKRELAAWLSEPYAVAASRLGRVDELAPPPSAEGVDLRPVRLAAIMESARLHTLTMLEELALPHAESDYLDEAIAHGFVCPAEDELGTPVWVPVDRPRMRLRDRVRSLFVADYLNTPHEYESSFFVCHRCEAARFDEDAKWMGFCRKHLRPSHTVARVLGDDAPPASTALPDDDSQQNVS